MTSIIGKHELSKRIAQRLGASTKDKTLTLTQEQIYEVLETTLSVIRETLEDRDQVRLIGFGSFKVQRYAAREGVNPHNKKALIIPAQDRVRFCSGKELAEAVHKD